jgi:uncharacterized membrane protein YkoI
MKISLCSLLLAITLTLGPLLHAAPQSAAQGTSQHSISQQRAVSIAQQVNPGRVLAVKRRGDVYRVKQLSDSGEVRVISIDAKSGKVVGR